MTDLSTLAQQTAAKFKQFLDQGPIFFLQLLTKIEQGVETVESDFVAAAAYVAQHLSQSEAFVEKMASAATAAVADLKAFGIPITAEVAPTLAALDDAVAGLKAAVAANSDGSVAQTAVALRSGFQAGLNAQQASIDAVNAVLGGLTATASSQ